MFFQKKLQERQSLFAKKSYDREDKAKLSKVLAVQMMSSEESGESDEDLAIKSLP